MIVSDTSTDKIPNMSMTGGSTTSESCCGAVQRACEELVARLRPIKAMILTKRREEAGESDGSSMSGYVSWRDLIKKASQNKINLSVQRAWRRGVKPSLAERKEEEIKHNYCAFGVACSEVEVDSLTGESKVLRTDIIYDCGKPLNPAIDLGQIEGGFVCGLGFLFREQLQLSGSAPTLYNHGTWEYKPPCSLDVPVDFRVAYLGKTEHNGMVLSSKARRTTLVLATSAFMALREAIMAARREGVSVQDFF